MKLGHKILIALCVLLIAINVPLGYAWLMGQSNEVENTFTVGDIQISLTERSGAFYKITPGTTIAKDPRVTVAGGSESCWLFVRIETTQGFDRYLKYSPDNTWQRLDGHTDIFYRTVEETETARSFPILEGDMLTVPDTLTEEILAAITEDPTMTFYAYAIQQAGIDSAYTAWQQICAAQE